MKVTDPKLYTEKTKLRNDGQIFPQKERFSMTAAQAHFDQRAGFGRACRLVLVDCKLCKVSDGVSDDAATLHISARTLLFCLIWLTLNHVVIGSDAQVLESALEVETETKADNVIGILRMCLINIIYVPQCGLLGYVLWH